MSYISFSTQLRRSMARLVCLNGMIVVGALGQSREIGDLLERKLVQRLAEIVERCRRDAVGVEAEEDLVEIELENLVLVEGLLDAMRQNGFLHLALDGALIGEEEVLGHLLGDGGGADDLSLAGHLDFDIAHARGREARPVKALMLVEGLVLGRDEGLDELLRDVVDRHEETALLGIFGNQRAVGGMHARHHRRLVLGELLIVGQTLGHVPDDVADTGGDAEERDESYREQASQEISACFP